MPIYEYECRACGERFEVYYPVPHDRMTEAHPSGKCKFGIGDRVYSLSTPKIWEPFTTTNILPDGEPVTVRGPGQLRQLEAEHKVRMVDGDHKPPQTKFQEPA